MINIMINWDLLLTDETKPELELKLELELVLELGLVLVMELGLELELLEVISDIGEKVSIQWRRHVGGRGGWDSPKGDCRHAAPPQAAPARKDVHLRDNIGNYEGRDREPEQEQDHLATLNVKDEDHDEEHDDPADKKLRHHVKPDHDEVINYNLLY